MTAVDTAVSAGTTPEGTAGSAPNASTCMTGIDQQRTPHEHQQPTTAVEIAVEIAVKTDKGDQSAEKTAAGDPPVETIEAAKTTKKENEEEVMTKIVMKS